MAIQSLLLLVAAFAMAWGAFVPVPYLSKVSRRSQDCDIEHCVEDLKFLEHPTTGLTLEALDDEDALNLICSKVPAMQDCFASSMANCDELDDMTTEVIMETLEGVTNYICSDEGRDALLTETDCWENSALEAEIQFCADSVQTQMYFGNDEPCSLVDSFRDCTIAKARQYCSDKAAKFVDRLVYYAMEPIADKFLGCELRFRITRDLLKLMKGFRK